MSPDQAPAARPDPDPRPVPLREWQRELRQQFPIVTGNPGLAYLDNALIAALRSGVPTPLVELRRLGRTLAQRAADVLVYFDRPGTGNGPTEALNGRLEHLRGSALGFRNLTDHVARSLLEAGGFRNGLHPRLRPSRFVYTRCSTRSRLRVAY